jgi:ABC-type polysaccharide/polyol phosphate transport system, ATPase component
MANVVIDVKNVSLTFRMNSNKAQNLKDIVVLKLKGQLKYEEFFALNNVSFHVNEGEVFGVIGRNGSGKSTILKIISQIYKPTKGTVAVAKPVVPMLELGSGFDYELTGRENVFLNGALLGYSQKFLEDKFDEIVAFSELAEFINMPLKTYSSGMIARLAFSIASMVKPEILILDEVLSVGDAAFQEKSLARMMELMGGGTTVLIVTHSIELIKSTCDRAVWLDKGCVRMVGDAEEVAAAYENM